MDGWMDGWIKLKISTKSNKICVNKKKEEQHPTWVPLCIEVS